MKNSNRLPVWVWTFVLVAAVVSLYSISLRHRVEAKNKSAAPALEYEVIAAAAASSGVSVADALDELKLQGLRAVVLPESTVGDYINEGRISVEVSGMMRRLKMDTQLAPKVREGFQRRMVRFEGGGNPVVTDSAARVLSVEMDVPAALVNSISLGLDETAASQVKAAGLVLVARHSNVTSPSMAYIDAILRDSAAKGATGFLPQGESVLGNRTLLKDTMELLRELDMFYCSPEFAKLTGETAMTVAGPDNTVRLHSIQAAEIERMSPNEVVDRFGRAFSERNQRLLLIRPFDAGGDTPLASLKLSLTKISRAIAKEGGAVGTPRTWEDPGVPSWVIPAIAVAVLGVCAAMSLALFSSPLMKFGSMGVVGAIVALTILRSDATYLATLAATVFPVLAYLAFRQSGRLHPLGQFALISAISLVGGLCVAGLLNGVPFYVRADAFFAVKLAHFLPIIVVGWLVVRDLFDLPKVAMTPITWGALGLAGLALFGLGLMLARTGNDNPAAVSGIELQFRSLLEKYFNTRPRTKEFLIGHPALIIGLMASASGAVGGRRHALGGLMIALGMIGQTSVVNTMCHLHTPVQVGLTRIAIGLVTGVLIGLALWPLANKLIPKDTNP